MRLTILILIYFDSTIIEADTGAGGSRNGRTSGKQFVNGNFSADFLLITKLWWIGGYSPIEQLYTVGCAVCAQPFI